MTDSAQSVTDPRPPRAQRRNLSIDAYKNDLMASREWKRRHPEKASKHWYTTCACGRRMRRGATRCAGCAREESATRHEAIVELRAQGLRNTEIATRLGTTRASIAGQVSQLRLKGVEVAPLPRGRPRGKGTRS